MFKALVVLLMLVGPASAVDGVYRRTTSDTCPVLGDDRYFELKHPFLHLHETTCEMTMPVNVTDMNATLYTLQCHGEGETWSKRALVMEHPTWMVYLDNDGAKSYYLCED